MTVRLAVGWAESLGKMMGEQGDDWYVMKTGGKRPHRQSKAHDLRCGVTGSRNGHATKKLNRVLGKVEEG